MNCVVLTDGYYSYPAPWFFPNANPSALACSLAERHLPLDNILSPYTCLLIQTGSHVVLIDTGAGELVRTAGALTARLEMAGVRRGDVNTVVLTHAHSDHIGGAVDARGVPVFPNARYVISEVEFDFWMAPRPDLCAMRVPVEIKAGMSMAARRCLSALRLRLDVFMGETEIVPGVRLIPAPGHTPGHVAVLLASGREKLLNMADAAVHPLHLERPDWENGFDLDCGQAASTRKTLLERAVSDRLPLMAFHFPFPSIGKVAARDAGWSWSPGL